MKYVLKLVHVNTNPDACVHYTVGLMIYCITRMRMYVFTGMRMHVLHYRNEDAWIMLPEWECMYYITGMRMHVLQHWNGNKIHHGNKYKVIDKLFILKCCRTISILQAPDRIYCFVVYLKLSGMQCHYSSDNILDFEPCVLIMEWNGICIGLSLCR